MKSPKNILVYDDDPTYCKVIKREGKLMGLNVKTCSEYSEFYSSMMLGNYDIFLIDYNLEEYRGDTVASQVSETPTFIISYDEKLSMKVCDMPAAISGFIPKTETPSELLNIAIKEAMTINNYNQHLKESV